MTTFRTLAAQVIRILTDNGRTQDSRLDERVIMRELRQAAARQIKMDWVTAKREFGDLSSASSQFMGVFRGVEVLEDDYNGENYCVLPGGRINIYNGEAIQRVVPLKPGYNKAMIQVMPYEMDIYESLSAAKEVLKTRFCFWPVGNKVYFSTKSGKTLLESGIKSVEITMITVDPNIVGDDDAYPIPQELEASVMREVLELHGVQFQENMLNDGNDTSKNIIDGRTVA